MLRFLLCFFFIFSFSASAQGNALFTFAVLKTSKGDIRLKLYKKEAPQTVENFVGLATGTKQFRDIKTGKKIKDTVFYKDMHFHKVHPDLGIQAGCPWGTGKGWPGYTLKAEKNELKFDQPYLIAMSKINGNDNSVGSQFFITTKIAPHLNKDYTVFGEVIDGKKVVDAISRVSRDAMMKPLKSIMLKEVIIEP